MRSQAKEPQNTRLSPTPPQPPAPSSTGRTPELLGQAGADAHRRGLLWDLGPGKRSLSPWVLG